MRKNGKALRDLQERSLPFTKKTYECDGGWENNSEETLEEISGEKREENGLKQSTKSLWESDVR